MCARRDPVVMGDEDKRRAALRREVEQKISHMLAGLGIEIAGGLIGKHNRRIAGERARDGDALLLPARELTGKMVQAIAEPHIVKRRAGKLCRIINAGDFERCSDIVEGRQRRQQVKGLKDQCGAAPPQFRELVFIARGNILTQQANAPRCGAFKAGRDGNHRRFAGARRADNRDGLPGTDGKINAAQDLNGTGRGPERQMNVLKVDGNRCRALSCQRQGFRFHMLLFQFGRVPGCGMRSIWRSTRRSIREISEMALQHIAAWVALIAIVCSCSAEPSDTPEVPAPSPIPSPNIVSAQNSPAVDGGEAGSAGSRERVQAGPTIVMLGDSLTAGYQLPADAALPAQLEGALGAEGVAARLINAGVSGDTTAAGLDRYDWSVGSVRPDILLIALGANDYLNGYPPDRARANLTAIIERAQADGITVGLIGLAARGGGRLRDQGGLAGPAAPRSFDGAYSAIYPELAQRFDLPLFPDLLNAVKDQPSLMLSDGLHPNAAGIGRIADEMAPFVARVIERWERREP